MPAAIVEWVKRYQDSETDASLRYHRLTSNDPMKGEIVSGNSGATAPRSFQFFVNPALTEEACSVELVILNRIAIEFASWGHSSVEELSRNIPALGSQNTSLNLVLRAVALVNQDVESDVWFK